LRTGQELAVRVTGAFILERSFPADIGGLASLRRPLAAPIDLTRYTISDSDFALLMKAAGEAAAGRARNEAGGG
jgi:hypothetical protein